MPRSRAGRARVRGASSKGTARPPVPESLPSDAGIPRRLVITVCPLEAGAVVLPVERGGQPRRLDARAVARALRQLVAGRRLEDRVSFREGCAGGCGRAGPNVDVTIHRAPPPGGAPDHVAIGWKTYVYSLASLDCLAAVIEENLRAACPGRDTDALRAKST